MKDRRKRLLDEVEQIDKAREALPLGTFSVTIRNMWADHGGEHAQARGNDLASVFKTAIRDFAVKNHRTDFQAEITVHVTSAGYDILLGPTAYNNLYNRYITCPKCLGRTMFEVKGFGELVCPTCLGSGKHTARKWWSAKDRENAGVRDEVKSV